MKKILFLVLFVSFSFIGCTNDLEKTSEEIEVAAEEERDVEKVNEKITTAEEIDPDDDGTPPDDEEEEDGF